MDQTLPNFTADVARDYLEPFLSGYGADMNSGWMQRVPSPKKYEFNISFGLVGMGAFLNNAPTSFSQSANLVLTSDEISYLTQGYSSDVQQYLIGQLTGLSIPVTVSGPTVVGGGNGQVGITTNPPLVFNYNGQLIDLANKWIPQGISAAFDSKNLFPMVAPQLTLGTFYGTNLVLRYFPIAAFSQGYLSHSFGYGVGFQHNPFVWFTHKPNIDFCLGIFYQHVNFENIVITDNINGGLYIGKTWKHKAVSYSLFGGASYQVSQVNFSYTYNNTPISFSFTSTGANNFCGTLGAGIKFWLLSLNADFNFAKYSTFTIGLSI